LTDAHPFDYAYHQLTLKKSGQEVILNLPESFFDIFLITTTQWKKVYVWGDSFKNRSDQYKFSLCLLSFDLIQQIWQEHDLSFLNMDVQNRFFCSR
jgi:hypothetical protein